VTTINIPLFPLPAVLFPGGYLSLRVFEQRYIDMVRECTATNQCFGVCLINNRENADHAATHHRLGTTAEICDFSTLDDGVLGIKAHGKQRYVINQTHMCANGLLMVDVNILAEETAVDVPGQYSVLSLITSRMMEQVGSHYPSFQPADLQNAVWIGYRLSELLPLENDERQSLLQLIDPLQRLQILLEVLPRFQEPGDS